MLVQRRYEQALAKGLEPLAQCREIHFDGAFHKGRNLVGRRCSGRLSALSRSALGNNLAFFRCSSNGLLGALFGLGGRPLLLGRLAVESSVRVLPGGDGLEYLLNGAVDALDSDPAEGGLAVAAHVGLLDEPD